MGLGRLVSLDKGRFVGQDGAAPRGERRGPAREIVGLEIDWNAVEALYETLGLAPQIPATASRVAVPVYREGAQVGQGDVDDLVADAEEADRARDGRARLQRRSGTALEMEVTVEAVRHRVPRDRREDAVLQSAAQDGDAGRLASHGGRDGSLGPRDPRLLRREGPARRAPGRSRRPGTWTSASPSSSARPSSRTPGRWSGAPTRSREPGQYVTAELAGEPIVVVRGEDGVLRGFFNVCRHHAAAVMTEPERQGAASCAARTTAGPTRWRASSRARPTSPASATSTRARTASSRSRRRCGRSSSSCGSTPGGPSLEQSLGPLVGQFAQLGSRALPLRRAPPLDLRLQLEGLRRQLPRRRLPRARTSTRGSSSVLDYSQLHDRDGRPLVPAVEPDRPLERRGRRWPPCARATRRSTTGSIRTS